MIAIHSFEKDIDNIHSIYVDQWDWEKGDHKEKPWKPLSILFVPFTVFCAKQKKYMAVQYDYIEEILPKEIAFCINMSL